VKDDDTEPTGREVAKGCAFLIIGIPASYALKGWAWLMLWGWFVQPLGAPAVTYWHALGLALVASLFMSNSSSPIETARIKKDLGAKRVMQLAPEIAWITIARWPVVVLLGWLVHLASGA